MSKTGDNAVFSDEIKIGFFCSDKPNYVRRRPFEALKEDYIISTIKFKGIT